MVMKNLKVKLLTFLLLSGFTLRGYAAEIFKNDDLDLNFGGRFQELDGLLCFLEKSFFISYCS